ncbi:cobaltochelatase subunit CobN [Sporomusa acidovorans]|uniref:Aerobic cobaltochelatase subunit CobN n=1 Tax=Sporomusa acidovorans (strain ATCC 49682 / DSM 3132 / Mol) TaxID=1123286 RepID=A0ABZ3IXX9_SPOA4|nr:cobaltochelatase subunit CobN [Sporomusa acidovorans]OZC22198.1 aerobic cobaltochelatase subunit CobN [Sporomusa acidovorans DSM 3132]SDE81744.1 cobaltochelatase CobN subunit [Sporomusa acidovorans]
MYKIGAIMWTSYMVPLAAAAREIAGLELKMCSMRDLEDSGYREEFFRYLQKEADALLMFPSTNGIWEEIAGDIRKITAHRPTIAFGYDPGLLAYNTVDAEIALTVQRYLTIGGQENAKNALLYIMKEVLGAAVAIAPPEEIAWQGIYYPGSEVLYKDIDNFMNNCPGWRPGRPDVGILFYRHLWVNFNTESIDALVSELDELGLNAIPVFSTGRHDIETGSRDNAYVLKTCFFKDNTPVIDCLIDLQSFLLVKQGKNERTARPAGEELLKQLDVPIVKALFTYGKTAAEWRSDPRGIGGATMVMSVSMPEMNGVIEPTVIGCLDRMVNPEIGGSLEYYRPLAGRVQYLCRRVKKWIQLRRKKPAERKVAFILHNSPCHGVELAVGGAANLDSLESVARIMAAMQAAGYCIENPPASGKELIERIMGAKAISDFRWTPIEEIVQKGGVIKYLAAEEYRQWFDAFPAKVQQAMIDTWGNPPGEEKDGVPAAMVYDNKILITGVEYGNVVVCCQPKRGCAGPRCDGQVCKILHDPQCPPTHQYVATYRYLEKMWGADAVVHVGTHGNLEFLPGKAVGLSATCFPEVALGTLPHLYIYNTDNPPEGTIAKRRSYATLVGHMQTVMVEAATYGNIEELEHLLDQYIQARHTDPARSHELEHLIMEKAAEAKLTEDIGQQHGEDGAAVAEKLHGLITKLKTRMHQDGLHIFGDIPAGERQVSFIQAVLKHDTGEKGTLTGLVVELMGLDYDAVKDNPQSWSEEFGKPYSAVLDAANGMEKDFVRTFIGCAAEFDLPALVRQVMGELLKAPGKVDELGFWLAKVKNIADGLAASREIDSLLHGFDGGYLPAGPSGLITRGRADILPTGRNFYSADPERIPTKAAWKVGQKLAEALIAKHRNDTGRIPENCGMVLFATDCMWTDGEQVAQILALLGVEPTWIAGGRVKGFRIMPLAELGRPRIDVTLRIGGVTRDCFPGMIDYLDEAIRAVAELDEPCEKNYIRKHALEQLAMAGGNTPEAWEQATARIFGSRPQTYGAGVSLAVHASAWKTEKDLADIFIDWSGYAYGKNRGGQAAGEQFKRQLTTVDLTYNKAATDEYDIFGCCCHFSYYGGLTAAARSESGNAVKTYFGDTRDPERPGVTTLAEEINNIIRVKILNPDWIESMKRHGYKGAGDMAKRITHVYGWEATTGEVADWVFDDLAKTYVLNDAMREWFEENNPWAMEEINRRLLEAAERGLWEAGQAVLEELKETYMEIEGWMEERMGDVIGEYQGGSIDIMTAADVPAWKAKLVK